jgi:branched-chain amino acid transport system substrate-binding protein
MMCLSATGRIGSEKGWPRVRGWGKAAAVVAVCVAATTACSSSAASDASGSGGAGAEPVKIALMVPLSGAAAEPKIYVDPARMAVKDLNDAGGIHGRTVELEKIDSGLTPQAAITAVRKAVGEKVSAIVGLPITSQSSAVRTTVNQARIPVLQLSVGDEANYRGAGKTGGASKYSFRIGSDNHTEVRAASAFAVKALNAKKVGLLADDDSATSVKGAFTSAVPASGGTVGAIRTYPTDATDLTNEVLAMKGNDAVIDWSYPDTIALGVKQMVQNGIHLPTVGSQSAANVFTNKLLAANMMKYLYAAVPCNPAGDKRENVKKWVSDFTARFHRAPTQNEAETYDAVKIFAAVVKKAGDDPASQLTRLENLDYSGGVCAQRYSTDQQHNTVHTAMVVSYKTGKPVTEHTYDFTGGGN